MVRKNGVMTIVGLFVIVLVAVVLMQATSDQTVNATTLRTYNTTAGDAAITVEPLGSLINLEGKAVTNFVAINASNGAVSGGDLAISTGNFTLKDRQNINGELTATLNASGAIAAPKNVSGPWNVTFTYQPLGFVTESSGRSIVSLLLIMMALGLLIVTAGAIFRSPKVREMLGMGR